MGQAPVHRLLRGGRSERRQRHRHRHRRGLACALVTQSHLPMLAVCACVSVCRFCQRARSFASFRMHLDLFYVPVQLSIINSKWTSTTQVGEAETTDCLPCPPCVSYSPDLPPPLFPLRETARLAPAPSRQIGRARAAVLGCLRPESAPLIPVAVCPPTPPPSRAGPPPQPRGAPPNRAVCSPQLRCVPHRAVCLPTAPRRCRYGTCGPTPTSRTLWARCSCPTSAATRRAWCCCVRPGPPCNVARARAAGGWRACEPPPPAPLPTRTPPHTPLNSLSQPRSCRVAGEGEKKGKKRP